VIFTYIYIVAVVKLVLLMVMWIASDNFYWWSCQVSIRDRVFETMLFFLEHADEEVQLKAMTGLGEYK
jgi:hypothetical protein